MPEMLLLLGDAEQAHNDNHTRLAEGFRRAGWAVHSADHDTLEVRGSRIVIDGRDPASFDLIWPLGFGRHATFFDRMQLLAGIPDTRFVNSPDVLLYLHGKHRWLDRMPETHTSTRPEHLFATIRRGGDWVLKPTGGSYGPDVTVLRSGEATPERVAEAFQRLGGGYVMAQRFVPEVAAGETRTLVAGGRPIASYLRVPGDGLISNLAAGGRAERTTLEPAELELVTRIGREAADLGAGFCAVDTVYPYLMEVNVANPGGLETIAILEGCDPTDQAVSAIVEWTARRQSAGAP